MTYEKPELLLVDSALSAIRHGGNGEKAASPQDTQGVDNLNCFVNEPDE